MTLSGHWTAIPEIAHEVRLLAVNPAVLERFRGQAVQYVRLAAARVDVCRSTEARKNAAAEVAHADPQLADPHKKPGRGYIWWNHNYPKGGAHGAEVVDASAWILDEYPIPDDPIVTHRLLHDYALLVAAHDRWCESGGVHGKAQPIMSIDFDAEYVPGVVETASPALNQPACFTKVWPRCGN